MTDQPPDDPIRPDEEPTRPDAEPIRPDEEPTCPDAEPIRADDEPTRPDEEPTQADEEPTPDAGRVRPEDPTSPFENPDRPDAAFVPPDGHSTRPGSEAHAAPHGPHAEAPRSEPRRLTRSADERVLAGVSGGLGRYFAVDPILFRIAFVVLTAAGGNGVLAYLAAWVLIPVAGRAATGTSRSVTILLAIVLALLLSPFLAPPLFVLGPPLVVLCVLAGVGYLGRALADPAGAGAGDTRRNGRPAGARRGRSRARPAHRARDRGPAPHRPRLHVQGDRRAPAHLIQDGGGARLGGAAQAPALQPARAQPRGGKRRLVD